MKLVMPSWYRPSYNTTTCPKLDKFCEYLMNRHMENNATFPQSTWTSHTVLLQQTTNACETFHSRFNACFYKAHPDHFWIYSTSFWIPNQNLHINSGPAHSKKSRTWLRTMPSSYSRTYPAEHPLWYYTQTLPKKVWLLLVPKKIQRQPPTL